ncbi:MAG TPA: peptide ABC transporter substrate-binding protein [Fusobacteriaceae bacterium]|nr:peptide ABC transporter substrate-binding protein [Fusobacteriaceae bacterium]
MKKIFYVLTLLMAVLLTACGGEKEQAKETDAATMEKVEQMITFNLGADPKSVDPQLNSATDGGIVINNTFEGLMRTDENGKAQPAGAESVDISDDKMTYTFHLRKDAKWSDGKPVTAADYRYAWLRALDPAVASEYSFQLYYIKGGQEYFEGKGSREDVGLEVVDDLTFKVTLKAPTAYFLDLVTFYTFMPVRQDAVEKKPEGWAKDPSITLSNGPFKISEYHMNDKVILVPNEYYWNKESVKLDKIVMTMIVDISTAMTAYDSDEVDVLITVPTPEIPKRQVEDPTFHIVPYLGTYYYIFNVNKAPTNDINVRKALTLAIDREQIVNEVSKGGQQPANGFVPTGLVDSQGNDFRATAGDYGISSTADVEKAKEYLAKAGYPNGEGMAPVELIYNTSEGHKAIAEAIQEMWKKNLGIEVNLVNQEWAVFQDTRHVGNFEVARAGWIGDYNDPMTFLDLWTSYSGNNDAQWSYTKGDFPENKKFDALIENSKVAQGTDRDKDLYAAEKILMDELVTMPIYYYTGVIMVKDKVKNWERDILGTWYLGNVEIAE